MDEWLNAKQVATLAGCGRDRAREIISQVNEDARAHGFLVPKESRAYKQRVLEKLGLKENT